MFQHQGSRLIQKHTKNAKRKVSSEYVNEVERVRSSCNFEDAATCCCTAPSGYIPPPTLFPSALPAFRSSHWICSMKLVFLNLFQTRYTHALGDLKKFYATKSVPINLYWSDEWKFYKSSFATVRIKQHKFQARIHGLERENRMNF